MLGFSLIIDLPFYAISRASTGQNILGFVLGVSLENLPDSPLFFLPTRWRLWRVPEGLSLGACARGPEGPTDLIDADFGTEIRIWVKIET
jgi:hypothetical protein